MLRDPAVTIPEHALRILAFVTDRRSPAYGEYPTQAGFAARALVQEIRARAAGQAWEPVAADRALPHGRTGALPHSSG